MAQKKRMRSARALDPWTRVRRAARARAAVPEPEPEESIQTVPTVEEPTAQPIQKKPVKKAKVKTSKVWKASAWARAQAMASATPARMLEPELAQTQVQDTPEQVHTPQEQEVKQPDLPPLSEYVRIPEQRVPHPATVLVRLEASDRMALERQARKARVQLAVYCRLALQWIARGGVAGGQS